jgi:hypothetical protein
MLLLAAIKYNGKVSGIQMLLYYEMDEASMMKKCVEKGVMPKMNIIQRFCI